MTTAVVFTGLGVTAPGGLGAERFWKSALTGRSGIAEVAGLDTPGFGSRLAGQVSDFVPEEHLPGRLLVQTDRSTQLALVAAAWALEDGRVDTSQMADYDMGVVTSNALGGFDFTHREFRKLWSQGPKYVSVYESFAWFYAVNTGQVSIRHGLRGPGAALVGEQAGGLDALGHARRVVRRGTPLVVGGGVDSALDPWGYAAQLSHGLTSLETDPARAYLPFDRAADGYVPGEGGAMLVMEDAERARRRGAPVYGELAGYAATFDPAPGSGLPPALGHAARLALADAGVRPDEVDAVFADAAGVPELDRAEAEMIRDLFGPRGVPVTAVKPLTGRLYSGGGPLDAVCALLALRDGVLPPTAQTADVPDEYQLDVVLEQPRELALRTVLLLARGHRGFNAAVVLRVA
ncbi:ketosynthase chain-length factor [Streptomyces sp. NPDC005395]|uniref:ketosynthase chain-length factor n=1 Tax=Streptomyces sp. NPDC005395 TaxID=3157042 RepID=UPI0033B32134